MSSWFGLIVHVIDNKCLHAHIATSFSQHKLTGEPLMWFMFQKTKYIHEDGKFRPLDFPTSHSFSHYLNCKGFASDMEAEAARQLYGKNR